MRLISNETEYKAIMARVDELVEIVDDNTPPTDKNYVELDFLADLIVSYEKEHFPIGKFSRSEEFVQTFHHEYEFA
jgi:HTH-type transcriptional regulator/antitoxin HigA